MKKPSESVLNSHIPIVRPAAIVSEKPLGNTARPVDAIKPAAKKLPTMDEIKARWKTTVGTAMLEWNKLTETELLQSQGHKKQLVDLLQQHHALSRDDANKQVNAFFEKHMN